MCDELAIPYCAAMLDGEGWVSASTDVNKRAVEIAGTCPETVYTTAILLQHLGIKWCIEAYSPKNPKGGVYKRCYKLRIYGKEAYQKLLALPFVDPDKRKRLEALEKSYVGRWPKK